jgi:hypothetical protein
LEGRPILVGGPPDLAAGRPRWRQGGPLTTYGRFDHLPDTGSYLLKTLQDLPDLRVHHTSSDGAGGNLEVEPA